jgi:hypothetical protein
MKDFVVPADHHFTVVTHVFSEARVADGVGLAGWDVIFKLTFCLESTTNGAFNLFLLLVLFLSSIQATTEKGTRNSFFGCFFLIETRTIKYT